MSRKPHGTSLYGAVALAVLSIDDQRKHSTALAWGDPADPYCTVDVGAMVGDQL